MGYARSMGYAAALSLATTLLIQPASAKVDKDLETAINATVEQASDLMTVKDDPMETYIEVDSERFYQARQGLLKVVNGDKFLRAYVDRKTKKAIYQVYAWVSYGGSWLNLDRANLEAVDGPVPAEVHRVNAQVEGCSRYGCTQREDIAIDVPEAILRWAASGAQPGTDAYWKIRVAGQSGQSGDMLILKTEVAGFMLQVDRARNIAPPKRIWDGKGDPPPCADLPGLDPCKTSAKK